MAKRDATHEELAQRIKMLEEESVLRKRAETINRVLFKIRSCLPRSSELVLVGKYRSISQIDLH